MPYRLDPSGPMRRLSRLKPTGEPDGTELTVEAHAGCIGHAAYVDDDAAWGGATEFEPVFVCTDWRVHGHEDRWTSAAPVRTGGPMTDEQKSERRQVIAGNRAWVSAQTVRRRWLKTFLARKAAPKDAPQWIAATLASSTFEVRRAMESGHQLALELLGLGSDERWTPWSGQSQRLVAAAQTATPTRAGMLTLALLLAGIEKGIDRGTWRNPDSTVRSYLTALERWGYALSDAERAVSGEAGGKEEPVSVVERAPAFEPSSDEVTIAEHAVDEAEQPIT